MKNIPPGMKSIPQTAKAIGIKPEALHMRISRGRCPEAVRIGKHWFLPDTYYEAYKDSFYMKHAVKFSARKGGFKYKNQLYIYLTKGYIPSYKCPLGKIRINRKDLERALGIPERRAAKRAQRLVRP